MTAPKMTAARTPDRVPRSGACLVARSPAPRLSDAAEERHHGREYGDGAASAERVRGARVPNELLLGLAKQPEDFHPDLLFSWDAEGIPTSGAANPRVCDSHDRRPAPYASRPRPCSVQTESGVGGTPHGG